MSSLSSIELNIVAKREIIQTFILNYPKSEADQRWRKILRLQERVDELHNLSLDALDRIQIREISDQLNDERQKVVRIHEGLRALKFPKSSSRDTAVPTSIRKTWNTAERVNTAADILGKLQKALTSLGALL